MNLSETIKLFHEGLTPVARSLLKPNWQHLNEDQVFYYKSQYHGHKYVLSFAFKFPFNSNDDEDYGNKYQFALSYPYTITRLYSFTNRWLVELKRLRLAHDIQAENRSFKTGSPNNHRQSPELFIANRRRALRAFEEEHFRTRSSLGQYSSSKVKQQQPAIKLNLRDIQHLDDSISINFNVSSLCQSLLWRSVHLLSVQEKTNLLVSESGPISSNDPKSLAQERAKVLILCKSFGNLNGPAMLIVQGMIDFLLGDHSVGKLSRRFIDYKFVPMLDPDSVFVGNSRTDLFGQLVSSDSLALMKQDKFFERNSNMYKNLHSLNNLLDEEIRGCRGSRMILIDLRVNYQLIGARLLGTLYDCDDLRMERHLALARLMATFCSEFLLEKCQFLKPASSGSLFDFADKPNVDQYCLEISPFASYKRSLQERRYERFNQQRCK